MCESDILLAIKTEKTANKAVFFFVKNFCGYQTILTIPEFLMILAPKRTSASR